MSPSRQNEAVARFLLTIIGHDNSRVSLNYHGDLNAIHAAFMTVILGGKDIVQYRSNEHIFEETLEKISKRVQIPIWTFGADLYTEGFLRAVGAWEGSEIENAEED